MSKLVAMNQEYRDTLEVALKITALKPRRTCLQRDEKS